MLKFVLSKAVSGLLLLVIVTSATFLLMALSGGDAARTILGDLATPDQVAAKSAELGLDRPVFARYGEWAIGAIHGDLGTSWLSGTSVATGLGQRFPVSLSLVVVSLVVTAVLAVVVGLTAAVRGGAIDRFVQVLSVVGFALPNFWTALLLVTLLAITVHWFPATGYTAFADDPGRWAWGLVLPVTALVVGTTASMAQQVRGAAVDVLRRDYIRTLRASGISGRSLLFRHVLRNAAPAALTVLSLQFIGLLGGTVFIERIFALPGIGSLMVSSVLGGDLPVVVGIVTVMVVVVVVVNFLIDLSVGWLSPKARLL
ncbi:ABC transporter permease [Curtobacterium sp. USHLN213]|uniref:ABC transporter permease n=1 Tax=Curtobacterium sp. USHLN213 TaxID=3081255 RepID=UPI003015C213